MLKERCLILTYNDEGVVQYQTGLGRNKFIGKKVLL
jgi:hypothetical protein